MGKPIVFKARSDDTGNDVFVWQKQMNLLGKTSQLVFSWVERDGTISKYTVQSALQAFLNNKYITRYRKSDNKKFFIFSKNDLVQVP